MTTAAALKADGTLWVWGTNRVGSWGTATQTDKTTPARSAFGPPSVYYLDEDGDGYGSTESILAYALPDGYSANNLDFDDGDPDANPGTERNALVALYNSTNGSQWRYSSGWLGTVGSECGWEGVFCNDDNRVTAILLPHNNLVGSIPPDIGSLTALEGELDLSFNQLSGSIPGEIFTLTALRRLVLHNNQLSGSIPPEIGYLVSLQLLNLSYNQLSGSIPPEIGYLVSLHG